VQVLPQRGLTIPANLLAEPETEQTTTVSNPEATTGPRLVEFVALTALMTSLVAMTIDAMLPAFFCVGLMFGNMNALAMEPLGHIAGIGAAVVGSLSTLLATPLGAGIGQAYNGSVTPLVVGFAVFGLGALALMRWAEGRRASSLQGPQPAA